MVLALNNTGIVQLYFALHNIFENATRDNVVNANDHNIVDTEQTAIILDSL